MNEILKMLNTLSADDLDSIIVRATIMLEKKRKDEAEMALLEKERLRQEKIAQERRRREEIAELQRKLQELQSQPVIMPDELRDVKGDNFVMHDTSLPGSNPAPSAQMVSCPHCRHLNAVGSVFCSGCGERMVSLQYVSQPMQQSAAQTVPQVQPAPAPVQRVQAAPAPAPRPSVQPQANTPQVRYAEEGLKKWEMLPGEKTERSSHDIKILQPDLGRKYMYAMEVTNKRILIMRISAVAASAGAAFGLVGSLARDLSGNGLKPWLEIPLTAVKNCGLREKKEFFIEADQTYVLKNKGYEKYLPALVADAKAGK